MTVPILRSNLEESVCVIKKCNTVLPGMAYWYYTTMDMSVYLDITNKTYLKNDNLFWKYASAKNLFWERRKNNSNHWQAV